MTATSPAGSSRHYCGAEDRATHRLKRINRAFEEACTGRPKDRSIVVARDRRKGSSSKSGGWGGEVVDGAPGVGVSLVVEIGGFCLTWLR
jgi:hypothetical protein